MRPPGPRRDALHLDQQRDLAAHCAQLLLHLGGAARLALRHTLPTQDATQSAGVDDGQSRLMLRTSASSRRDRSDIDIVLRLASRAPCPRDPGSNLWETQARLQRITAALTDSRSDADDRTLSTSRLLCLLLWRLRAEDAREVDAERGSSTSGEAAGAT